VDQNEEMVVTEGMPQNLVPISVLYWSMKETVPCRCNVGGVLVVKLVMGLGIFVTMEAPETEETHAHKLIQKRHVPILRDVYGVPNLQNVQRLPF